MKTVCSLALLALLLCASQAHAQCFLLTVSARQLLDAQLTKAERATGQREAKRRGCSTAPVPEGTPGALDAGIIAGVLPEIRKRLHVEGSRRARPVKAKARAVARRPVRRAVMKRARPRAVSVRPKALPASRPVTELPRELVAPATPARAGRIDRLRDFLRRLW